MRAYERSERIGTAAIVTVLIIACSLYAVPQATRKPLMITVDLDVGQEQTVTLCDGSTAKVKLLLLEEQRDTVRQAVREAQVQVEVNGKTVVLVASTYHLPKTVAGVQIDCAVTKGYLAGSSKENAWGLLKDARLRLWPAGSPWIDPDTFMVPARQKWFASDTQMANVPVFVDGGEVVNPRQVYYHYGLDFGGAEGLVDVVAATDGLVVSSGTQVLKGYEDTPVKPRYDVIYLLDDRGWFYRYSHLNMIATAVLPGYRVRQGERIGILGKEGGSGGWSHLHFDISAKQPSGLYGIVNGYPFIWQAYIREFQPDLIAVARPHHLVRTGEKVTLDGSKSWSKAGRISRYEWTLSDGTTAQGRIVTRTYDKPGEYSEILQVTDLAGHVDYDFAVVQALDVDRPDRLPPTIHAAYYPTFGIRPGDTVTFKVRSFRTTFGKEEWDFGDGSDKVIVQSDGNAEVHSLDGYAVTQHAFAKAGDYIVTVQRTNEYGYTATTHLNIRVER